MQAPRGFRCCCPKRSTTCICFQCFLIPYLIAATSTLQEALQLRLVSKDWAEFILTQEAWRRWVLQRLDPLILRYFPTHYELLPAQWWGSDDMATSVRHLVQTLHSKKTSSIYMDGRHGVIRVVERGQRLGGPNRYQVMMYELSRNGFAHIVIDCCKAYNGDALDDEISEP